MQDNIAAKQLHNSIPDKYIDIAVDTVATVDLGALPGPVDLRGKWVRLYAVGGLSFMRGTFGSLAAGQGAVLTAGQYWPDRVWIDVADDIHLTTVKTTSSTTLRIFYTDDTVK